MKMFIVAAALVLGLAAKADTSVAREIVIETKKIDDKTRWMPEKIEVSPGERIKIVAKHELEGGFDFHGLFIPALKITKQVNRNQPLVIETVVPATVKEGEHKVACHFHDTHVPAVLVVKAKK